jgi:alpha-soluble NSF attachment protein
LLLLLLLLLLLRVLRASREIQECLKEQSLSSLAMSLLAQKQKSKAEEFVKQAEATLAKKAWFASGKERNQEDAAEIFLQAANAYKLGGLNQEAGDVYARAAEIYRDGLKNPNEGAKAFQQAGE